jgi:hypothetical protein
MKNDLAKTVELKAVESCHDLYVSDPLGIYSHRMEQNEQDNISDIPADLHGQSEVSPMR